MAEQIVAVEILGIAELKRGTEALVENIDEAAPHGLKVVADQAAGDTRGIVPYRSGKLAGSVRSSITKSEKKASVRIGARVPYAGWIEFGGTRGRPYIPAGRYLYPTAFDAEGNVIAAAAKTARDEIRSMQWPKPRT